MVRSLERPYKVESNKRRIKMKIWFIYISTALLLQVCRACDDQLNDQFAAARDDSAEYLANAYGYRQSQIMDQYYYQPNSQISGFVNQYEGRASLNKQPQLSNSPFKSYLTQNNIYDGNQPEGRFSGLGASILNSAVFNNRFPTGLNRPFANLANRLPISLNPNFANPIAAFDSCTAPSGESGICAPGSICSLFGGRPSGSCLLGGVCCINAITTCGGIITLNNTYWQSPATAVSSSSTCAVTVKLDTKLIEQKKSICQVRLDFVSFSIAQPIIAEPTAGDCTDTFRVSGALNTVPTICGDNSGQHMYLHVPPSDTNPTDLQLMLNFDASATTRSWNIKISMLPCGASYLAPSECLQYFTASSGRVSSFNWRDVAATAVRQLNNHQYNICFRNELIDSQRATQMCLSVCTTTTAGADAFGLTDPLLAPANSGTRLPVVENGPFGCLTDFLHFLGGTAAFVSADRYCGGAFNPIIGAVDSVQVCSSIKPFKITYNSDIVERAARLNQGFCLFFQQSLL